jgi:putative ABC transport system substrate-binding protein
MKRRDLITLLGSAVAAWPLVAHAQQAAMPVIGLVCGRSENDSGWIMAAFHRGLNERGLVEKQNVAIEYRWAEYRWERLDELMMDLVRRPVTAIAALSGSPTAIAAKAATQTIPIVFANGSDPVDLGLVTSLSRPDGNITGISFLATGTATKRFELLRELVPKATTIALLVNPNTPPSVSERTDIQAAARTAGQKIEVYNATRNGDIDRAFAAIAQRRLGALLVTAEPFSFAQRDRLVALAARHAIPTIYWAREFAEGGGLISYGASQKDAFYQAGIYIGRILKGEKPADLPVMLPTKFEVVVNLKTAKALGLDVPTPILLRADAVIE